MKRFIERYWALITITALLVAVLSGCAATPEKTWQTLHAIDLGQTLHIARAPACYHEGNEATAAVIGEHPSEEGVVAIMVTYAVLHYYIGKRLEALEDKRWLKAFQYLTILQSARTVVGNHQLGLRPFGSGGCFQ